MGAALVSVAACNEVFELTPTISVDPIADVDDDGALDDVDNCPTLANDQSNDDGDPFGNACDRCPSIASATTHDEDGDLVGDECDVCPAFEDLAIDTDGDGVGDTCDPNPQNTTTADRRLVFEPFVEMPVGWEPGAVVWSVADDSIAPDVDLAPTDAGMKTSITTGAGHWATSTVFIARTRWQPGERFGLVATGPGQTFSCVVTCDSNGCIGTQGVNGAAFVTHAVLPRPSMLVAIYVINAGSASCVFEGVNMYNPQFATLATSSMVISLVASPRIRATYLEHLE